MDRSYSQERLSTACCWPAMNLFEAPIPGLNFSAVDFTFAAGGAASARRDGQ
ncbi:hypothetical protein X737_00255 [Mesorhizobium sp. L48C026A00]|nr:hypothetical protein X737_00255 [Mesorhizobium sp. L48C026A00]